MNIKDLYKASTQKKYCAVLPNEVNKQFELYFCKKIVASFWNHDIKVDDDSYRFYVFQEPIVTYSV